MHEDPTNMYIMLQVAEKNINDDKWKKLMKKKKKIINKQTVCQILWKWKFQENIIVKCNPVTLKVIYC